MNKKGAMTRRWIVLCFIIASTFSGLFAQKPVLLMHKIKNGKEKIVRQAEKIKVKDREGNEYKGPMAIMDDSVLVISGVGIPISDIVEVRKVSLGSKILGGILAGSAGLATTYGSYGIIVLLSEGGFAIIGAIILIVPVVLAAVLTGVGVLIMSSGKRYKNSKWKFSIAPDPSEAEPARTG